MSKMRITVLVSVNVSGPAKNCLISKNPSILDVLQTRQLSVNHSTIDQRKSSKFGI